MRQYAFPQNVPAEVTVQRIQLQHDDLTKKDLSRSVARAWDEIVYKGLPELGIRRMYATGEYQSWLAERIKGVNPAFAPLDPLLNGNKVEMNNELARRLQKKDEEVEKLKREDMEQKETLVRLQNQNAALQETIEEMKEREACEVSLEVTRLKEENLRLKRTIKDVHRHVEENDQRMKNNRIRLMHVVKERDALAEEVQGLRQLKRVSRELEVAAKQLEEKTNELAVVKNELREQARQQAKAEEDWRVLYSRKEMELDRWRNRAERLVMLVNASIPRFSDVFEQAEHMSNPFNTSVEMSNFLLLCKDIMEELKHIAQSW